MLHMLCLWYSELCAIHKPGGLALDVPTILELTQIASKRAAYLHILLRDALVELEVQVQSERAARLELLRVIAQDRLRQQLESNNEGNYMMQIEGGQNYDPSRSSGGIDRDDPMLAWGRLHQASAPTKPE